MSILTIPFGAKMAAIVLAGVVATGASVAASISATGIAFEEIAELTTTEEEAPDPVVEAGELPAIDTESGLEEEGEEEGEETEDGEEDGDASTKGPDATGSSAWGLCNAWGHGGLPDHSTAYASLEAAAGSADEIEEYCDSVPAHGNSKNKGGDDAEDGDETTDEETETTDDGETAEDSDEDSTETEKGDKADKTEKAEKAEKAEKSNNGNGKSGKSKKQKN